MTQQPLFWLWLTLGVVLPLTLGISHKISWKSVSIWLGVAFLPLLIIYLIVKVLILGAGGTSRSGNRVDLYVHDSSRPTRSNFWANKGFGTDMYVPRANQQSLGINNLYVPKVNQKGVDFITGRRRKE